MNEVKFESTKFETLRTIDQSSDAIGIERQHSNDHVIEIYLLLSYYHFLLIVYIFIFRI